MDESTTAKKRSFLDLPLFHGPSPFLFYYLATSKGRLLFTMALYETVINARQLACNMYCRVISEKDLFLDGL